MRHRLTSSLGILIGTLLIVTIPLQAQQGSISGQVTDQSTGQSLAQAQIQVLGGGTSGGALSDAQGNFTLSLDPGSYSVVAVLLGYETVRVDGISVSGGAATEITVEMTSTALALAPVSVTVSRGQEASSLSAPAQVSIVTADDISRIASTSTADFLKALPGVDVSQVGINQSNTVTRGFNNVFSGALLVLTDYRYARIPSIRLNNYNLHPTTPLDIERIEVVLGPAAALYGPNATSGVMHIITSSPIDRPGTSVALSGGNQSMLRGVFRHAWAFSEKAGLKVSGQYFRGNDFEYTDPVEAAARAVAPAGSKIGVRDFFSSHYGGEARLDLRPWDDPNDNIIITGGLKTLGSSIEPTGIGAGQAKNWTYKSLQARVNKSGLFVQAFLNNSSAGDTYLLRTGNPIVDNSVTFATQGQYNFDLGDRFSATVGVDYSNVTPKTGGTINGANENNDETTLFGAYLQTTTTLTDQLDFVAAIRRDTHNWLDDAFLSPRLGLVLTPDEGHSFRATYNRSFSTPTSNNLFLDILAGRSMVTPTVGYNVRAAGIPGVGFTFNNTCAGGLNGFCMYSPFAPGAQLPANGAVLWDNLLVPLMLQVPALAATLPLLGLNAASFAAIVGSPQPGELTSTMFEFSQAGGAPFVPTAGPQGAGALSALAKTTWELGYTGLIGDKVRFDVSAYSDNYKNFIGPLTTLTPNVFLDGNSVATYLVTRLAAVGVPTSVAQQLAAAVAPTLAQVPLGTIVPDGRSNSDMLLTYRNYGKFSVRGMDLGMEAHVTDQVTLSGSYSYVSDECYDVDNDGSCLGSQDIALNAPTSKGAIGLDVDNKVSGVFYGARLRMSAGFPVNSGVYRDVLEAVNVVDMNAGYRLPGTGTTISTTINNVFNNKHKQFVGVPDMGILALLQVQFEF